MNARRVSSVCPAYPRFLLVFLGMPLIWLGSCRSHPPGEITIDKAEVFTRERLVNRRLQEQRWLENKLKFDSLDTTFQGSSDLREFRGVVASLKAQVDPLGGALQEATLESQIRDRGRQDELAAVRHDTDLLRAEIERLKAEQDLARLRGNPDTNVAGSPAAAATSASGTAGRTPPDASAGGNPFESLQKTAPPDAKDLVPSTAKLTSVEKLRDELAYRNAVHAALRETELDDAHDRNGYTLQTLKFDISVTPGDYGSEDIGMIRLTAEPNDDMFGDPNRLKDIYRAWQQSLLQQARLEALSLQRRYMHGLITDDDIVCFALTKARITAFLASRQEAQRKEIADLQKQLSGPPDFNNLPAVRQREERITNLAKAIAGLDALQFDRVDHTPRELDEDTSMALCKIAEWRYRSVDRTYLYFNDNPAVIRGEGKRLYLPDVWPSPERISIEEGDNPPELRKTLKYRATVFASLGENETTSGRERELAFWQRAAEKQERLLRQRSKFDQAEISYEIRKDTERIWDFMRALRELNGRFRPYVYTVEPKELAQNISDVAAAEKLSSLVLAASAALPQSGVNADGYLSLLDRSQLRLQAILRRPLVVGFVDQKNEDTPSFGWALGPRFEIGHKRGFLNEAGVALFGESRSSVRYRQAEVQHSVQATLAIPGWLDKIRFKCEVGWRDPSRTWPHERKLWSKPAGSLTVHLSRDYDALTSALLTRHQSYDQVPTVLPAESGDPRVAPYVLAEGEEKAGLLIRGANLWRNPKVFIGGQEATDVSVLPDMGGLHAVFDKVKLPTTPDHGSARVDLTIVTSQGIARLPEAVQILSKTTVKPAGTVELKTAYATCLPGRDRIELAASDGLIPKTSHFGAHLRARDITHMTWFDVIAACEPNEASHRLIFTLDPSRKLIDQPARLVFDLAIQDEYGTPYRSIPCFAGVKGELVYFPEPNQAMLRPRPVRSEQGWGLVFKRVESDEKLKVTTYQAQGSLEFQTDPRVSLDLLKRAHPWLAEEKTAFRVEFKPKDREPITVPFAPGELRFSEEKPGTIAIAKSVLMGCSRSDPGSKEQALFDLVRTIAPGETPSYDVRIVHPGGKQFIAIDGKLGISVQ